MTITTEPSPLSPGYLGLDRHGRAVVHGSLTAVELRKLIDDVDRLKARVVDAFGQEKTA